MSTITLEDGKYTVNYEAGVLTALRNGQTWRDMTGDKLVGAMFDEIERLRAATGWQPIATAPKHTPIRLYAQGGGFYDEDFNPSGSVEGLWCDDSGWIGAFWDGEHDCWQRREGIVPTHWMPLPAPLAEVPDAN